MKMCREVIGATRSQALASSLFAYKLGFRIAVIVFGASLACGARAELQLDPYLSAQREYQSNVFAVSGREEAKAENDGDATLADNITRGAVGIGATYNLGLQTLQATAEASRYLYQHFNRLDHDEYLLASRLKWVIGPIVDGTVDFRQESRLSPFEDRNNSDFDLNRDTEIGETLNLMVTPEWRIETGFRNHELDAPQPDDSFVLKENYGDFAVKYLGIQKLLAGLKLAYVGGNYAEQLTSTTTTFHQTSAELTLNYIEKDFSIFSANLGYTQRRGDDEGPGSASGITGSLGYSRIITAKTSVDFDLYRRINSYSAGVSSIVDSGVGIGLLWKASSKVTVTGRYDWVNDVFYGVGLADDPTNGRKDTVNFATLRADYRVQNWLLIRPYLRYRVRTSNDAEDEYHQSVAGIELRGDFGGPSGIEAGLSSSSNRP